MKLLCFEQINLNLSNKFVKTYGNKKSKKKEVNDDFHKMLIDEQEQLDNQNIKNNCPTWHNL